MVTISDVAHAAGVSKATVSYVLSGDPRITQATTLKVQHAIDELGYTVNHAARALSVRKTKTIGVVSPAFHGNYLSALFGLYVYLLSEEATKKGYDTLLIGENDGFEAMHEAWSSKKVDGFILMDVKDEDPRVNYAAKENIPTVAFGSPKNSHGLDTVDSDFAKAASSILNFLASEGHKEVILIPWSRTIFNQGLGYAWRFLDSATETAKRLVLKMHIEYPKDDDSDPSPLIEHALDTYTEATALILHNEPATIVAPQILARRNLRTPDDLRVVTVFPKQLATSMKIPFAAVHPDITQLSEAAVGTLLRRINNPQAPRVARYLDYPLAQGTA